MEGWPFTGRDGEVAEIVQLLGRDAGRAVLISGPAGIGKTRLATEALAQLRRHGRTIAVVRATLAAREIPYGALAHLLPAAVPPGVVNPLRWAVDSVLAGIPDRRLALLVDDAHLLDPASAAVLHHLVQDRRTAVLVTVRTGEKAPDAVSALWRDGLAVRWELPPLDEADTSRVLAAVLIGPVEPAAVRQLCRLAEGNLLLLRELVLAARRSGALSGPPWRLTSPLPVAEPRLTELVDARIGNLDEDEAEVLECVALGEPLDVATLVRLCPAAAVERCEARELVRVTDTGAGDQVRLAHPLYGEVIRARCPALRMRRRYRDLVAVAEQSGSRPHERLRLAVWRLEAGEAGDPAGLLAACRIAWAAHDYPVARRLATASVSAGGGVDAAIMLATVLNDTQAVPEAAAVLATVPDDADLTERQHCDLTLTRAVNLAMTGDQVDEAFALLTRTRNRLTDMELRQNIDVLRMNLMGRLGDVPGMLGLARTLLDAPPATPALRAQVLSVRSACWGMSGRFLDARSSAHDAVDDIDAWRDGVPALVVPLYANWYLCALYAGDLSETERALASFSDELPNQLGWNTADNLLLLGRAQLHRMRGQLLDAAATAGSAQAGPMAASCQAERAHALALAGDAAGAREALTVAQATQSRRFVTVERQWITLAEPWVAAAAGELDRAVRLATGNAERAAVHGMEAFAAVSLHDAVRLGAARQVRDRLTALAEQMQGELGPIYAAHARAAAGSDGGRLLTVASRFERLGFLLHAAEAAAQATEALRSTDGPGSRAASRAQARADRLARLCQQARTPPLAHLAMPQLSPREREIAALAASGLTSPQIAARLVLSVRTVDNHLQHAYTKLGITGRDELRGVVG